MSEAPATVVEDKLASAIARARQMIGRGNEDAIVVMHTRLPLREVVRIRGDMRRERLGGDDE